MRKTEKEVLDELSKEQLIYLIEQMQHSMSLISCVCVDESKWHIKSDDAINKIRKYIYHMPSFYNAEQVKNFIDMKMGKKTIREYRDFIGIETDETDEYYADPGEDTVFYKLKEFREYMESEKEHELMGIYSGEIAKRIDEEKMEVKNDLIDDFLYYFDNYFRNMIYEE